jgi:hypothetical protein
MHHISLKNINLVHQKGDVYLKNNTKIKIQLKTILTKMKINNY